MADIDQFANESGDGVRFSASSPRGDTWMRVNWGDIDVSFDGPDLSGAKAFRDAAVEAGLTIRDLSSN